jgi:hypothetical protein
MANQDDYEDFSALKKAFGKDNDFTGSTEAGNQDRKQPLLCHSPTSPWPGRTGKSSRKATSSRRESGIKVTPATLDNMMKL